VSKCEQTPTEAEAAAVAKAEEISAMLRKKNGNYSLNVIHSK
jgi:hypothetical protein